MADGEDTFQFGFNLNERESELIDVMTMTELLQEQTLKMQRGNPTTIDTPSTGSEINSLTNPSKWLGTSTNALQNQLATKHEECEVLQSLLVDLHQQKATFSKAVSASDEAIQALRRKMDSALAEICEIKNKLSQQSHQMNDHQNLSVDSHYQMREVEDLKAVTKNRQDTDHVDLLEEQRAISNGIIAALRLNNESKDQLLQQQVAYAERLKEEVAELRRYKDTNELLVNDRIQRLEEDNQRLVNLSRNPNSQMREIEMLKEQNRRLIECRIRCSVHPGAGMEAT